MHLRVGDVIDKNKQNKKGIDFFEEKTNSRQGEDWAYYVKHKSLFDEHVKILKSKNIKKISIVYGTHLPGEYPESKMYLALVKLYLTHQGFRVSLLNITNPDDSFIFMSSARYFIGSGGQFSKMVTEVARRRKAQLLLMS